MIITHTILPGRSQHLVASRNLLNTSAYLSRTRYGTDVDKLVMTEDRWASVQRQLILRIFQYDTDMNWNEITDKLLQRECSAVETYQQALRKERQESGRNEEFQELATILSDHQQAASQLEARIQQPERRAAHGFGGWGTWSKVVMGAANIFGDRVVLRALKAGEESGFKRYQEVLGATATPAELKPLFLDLLAKQQAHIRALEGLMSKDGLMSKG